MRKGSKQASPTTGAAASDEGSDELLFSPSQFQFDANAHANANTNNVVVVTVPPLAHGGASSSGYVSPRSPGPVGMMPSMSSMAATPDSVMSPDALLRAYAERRATASSSSSSTPANAVNGMRTANNTPAPAPLIISPPISPISPPVSASASTPYGLSSPVTTDYNYNYNYGNYDYGDYGNYNYGAANGMRTLYSPAGSGVRTQPGGRESVYSVAGNEEDAYGGHV
ncbi:hypothetical protein PLEOSDRAFT_163824 [Pleurotus ostreatus PC15]|uniref:Uncharacterized protein n=1 Tax=Pleurotus ostreatus (strain PC15) TaxID=1137138 RepID=A0A067N527_PLEO1|nr:hypothetical protein PLEOSDRAFT_163824 [Pleurotus ostreatus PC15]